MIHNKFYHFLILKEPSVYYSSINRGKTLSGETLFFFFFYSFIRLLVLLQYEISILFPPVQEILHASENTHNKYSVCNFKYCKATEIINLVILLNTILSLLLY